ncbi:MAG: sulfatase [Lentisphaeraceae bacterium]|nr:sulfatase [Lentisphaeraceae bacterium]
MKNLISLFILLLLSNFTYADFFQLKGKLKKVKSQSQDAIVSENLILDVTKDSYAKGSDVELSFKYLDTSGGSFFVTYLTNDSLDKSYETKTAQKIVDAVKFRGTGKWVDYSVLLKNVNFDQENSKFDISISGKPSAVSFANISLNSSVAKAAVKAKKVSKPNVLMIIVDDLNSYVGAFGDKQALTPNVDKFVAGSVKFTRAYCQYPVCGPSRASFLSGLYPERSGVIDNTVYLREENKTAVNLFEHFKNSGYWTGAAGKVFHSKFGLYEKGVSLDEYEYCRNADNPQRLLLQEKFMASGSKGKFQEYYKKNRVNDQGERVLNYGTSLKDDEHGDGRSARKVARWLKDYQSNKPFMIACGLVKPHVPFYAPKKYFDMYDESKLKFDDVPEDHWANKPKIAAVKGYKRFGADVGVNDRAIRAENLKAYLACISFMDAQVKVLLDGLKASGQEDNTIVIFMSDHGFQIGEHFMYGKVTLFEECAKVPFAIRLPKNVNNGKSSDSFAELVDIFPTLIDLCKLPATPQQLSGKSLVPILKNPTVKVKDFAYTVVSRGQRLGRTVRNDVWRFTHWDNDKEIELYNIVDDPKQNKNLANSPEYKEVISQMRKLMKSALDKK